MDEDISYGYRDEAGSGVSARGRLVPIKVGGATVYIERVDVRPEDDDIYTAAPTSEDAFEQAGEVLKECVRVVGEHVTNLGEEAKPREVAVEFSLSFEAKAGVKVIPLLLTGEAKAASGLKVTAVWGLQGEPGGRSAH